ncbi:general transcription factor IIH subunit 2 [Trichuris trichiura]|uniref:General transcription factor IIH subunit 2 n=1 Tax=Trichuris trichiura TaxID=36087 RepID=A0A077ZFD5_TRITR|nr:general transcription factor IIH subunit 2 [Trichuris trichiura]
MEASVINAAHENKRKELYRRKKNIRLGIVSANNRVFFVYNELLQMRQVCLVLDMSAAMNDRDLQPTRLLCTLKVANFNPSRIASIHLSNFVDDFFDQNPISQVCLLGVKDKTVKKLTEFAGKVFWNTFHILLSNPRKQKEALKDHLYGEGSGEFSLQNSLEMTISLLKDTPSHCIREVLVVVGSLGSCDPGDITTTIDSLVENRIICNLVVLSAEVFVYKKVAEETGGAIFWQLNDNNHSMPDNPDANLTRQGYYCPQCKSKYCSLPTECRVCGLILISAQHLARSHQHLFPVGTFAEVDIPKEKESDILCYGCFLPISVRAYTCTMCKNKFCIDCNLFIHETLHVCPGC